MCPILWMKPQALGKGMADMPVWMAGGGLGFMARAGRSLGCFPAARGDQCSAVMSQKNLLSSCPVLGSVESSGNEMGHLHPH